MQTLYAILKANRNIFTLIKTQVTKNNTFHNILIGDQCSQNNLKIKKQVNKL